METIVRTYTQPVYVTITLFGTYTMVASTTGSATPGSDGLYRTTTTHIVKEVYPYPLEGLIGPVFILGCVLLSIGVILFFACVAVLCRQLKAAALAKSAGVS